MHEHRRRASLYAHASSRSFAQEGAAAPKRKGDEHFGDHRVHDTGHRRRLPHDMWASGTGNSPHIDNAFRLIHSPLLSSVALSRSIHFLIVDGPFTGRGEPTRIICYCHQPFMALRARRRSHTQPTGRLCEVPNSRERYWEAHDSAARH